MAGVNHHGLTTDSLLKKRVELCVGTSCDVMFSALQCGFSQHLGSTSENALKNIKSCIKMRHYKLTLVVENTLSDHPNDPEHNEFCVI